MPGVKNMAFKLKDKKWLGYFVYVVLVAMILLYILFPAEAVEEFIDNSVSRANPKLSFKAGHIGPWVPAGLRLVEAKVILTDNSQVPLFRAEKFYAGPQIAELFKGGSRIQLDGKVYKGEMHGWLDLPGQNNNPLAGEINFKNFDLASHELLAQITAYKVIGRLGGNITFNGNPAEIGDLNGKVVLRLSDGQLQFQEPIFGIASIDMKSIDFELGLDNRQVNVIKAELSGSEIKGSLTGSIQLHKDFMQSSLNLKGTLEPLAEFYKNNPNIREMLKNMKKRVKRGQYFFAVTGTLDDPRFKLL
jgi:type II secretion system protein N